ncbi:hypothetical protein IAG44_39800 [Streptomyces roseirectus]|uniref:Uncharacterized protein n=1 Tax=Streptomyces roseirectus TaxID=2768066 RepID=A0A7H0IQ94_9ACTN|nr:hypothetical protein [Streptomyces roseirectus]QNP74960.1 hypothetical protein IAG44_39800 [Streptomyces roseirectus]
MAGMPVGVAMQMLSRRTANDEEALSTLLCCLRRSLVGRAIDDQLRDSLDVVLGELAPPAPHEMTALADRVPYLDDQVRGGRAVSRTFVLGPADAEANPSARRASLS